MSDFEIREANHFDLEAIVAIELASFPSDPWSARALEAELLGPARHYFVAETTGEGKEVIGYAGVLAPDSADADVATIAVDPLARGKGVGLALMQRLLEVAKAQNALRVHLEVRLDNQVAQQLYRKLGFVDVRVRKGYYEGGKVDALSMMLEMAREPLVLGIETSCDETGVGIVRGRTLLANEIASSAPEHERFGGVVPEIAARAHLEAFEPTIKRALETAGVTLADIDAIAVTAGPGLAGALMVGVGAAKALAASTGKPIYGVNHLVGHVSAGLLNAEGEPATNLQYPAIALLVSGGHTELLLVRDLVTDTELLGQTLDDAAGEAFDKVARLLDLPYPGGPHIDKAAASGNPDAFNFPRALTLPKDQAEHRFDFSFSGLKTAVWRTVQQLKQRGEEVPVADIAASFRAAVIDVLLTKAIDACKHYEIPRLMLGGGVVANAQLRDEAARLCEANGIELLIPSLKLATDNGAMIAALGAELISAGLPASALTFAVDPIMPVSNPLSNNS